MSQQCSAVPEKVRNAITRRMAAKEFFKDYTDPKAGQVWLLNLPSPLLDTITDGLVPVPFFLQEETESGDWYGFLCTSKLPKLSEPLKRWQYVPWLEWQDAGNSTVPCDPLAEYIVITAPCHAKNQWLVQCLADFGEDVGPSRVWDQAIYWLESYSPGLDDSTYATENQIGGHPIMDVVSHIRDNFN